MSTPLPTPAATDGSRAQLIAFLVMVVLLLVAPIWVYPIFMMKVMCFALFA